MFTVFEYYCRELFSYSKSMEIEESLKFDTLELHALIAKQFNNVIKTVEKIINIVAYNTAQSIHEVWIG